MHDRDRSATQTCLSLPEIVFQIGSHLFEPRDLYAASCTNRLWHAALLPLRSEYPHVTLDHLSSFLSFLKSNRRAAHHCRALRVLCDDVDDEPVQYHDSDSDFEPDADSDIEMERESGDPADNTTGQVVTRRNRPKSVPDLNAFVGIVNHLADNGKLRFFMYALPGEPCVPLPDDVWLALRKMSDTLHGLYVELVVRHWDMFLHSHFSNLTYLRLFLDSDEQLPFNPARGVPDPKTALLDFLQAHSRLEVLHLYLGTCFADLNLAAVHLPRLRSFLLISKAEGVNITPFLIAHPGLKSLDVYTDTDVPPFPADSLPNIQALQVSAMTVSWFSNILSTAAQRTTPIRHMQITAARRENFQDVLQKVAALGTTLRCLELIFWSRNVPLLSVLEDVNRVFPKLVEVSLFIPSWGTAEWEEEDKPVELASMLQCFAQNKDLLAFSVSDPKTDLLDEEQVQAVPKSCIPPRLRYVIWRSQTFGLDRSDTNATGGTEEMELHVERTYHPRNFRGSRYLRDWHEEMALDHLTGDYEAQLRTY